MTTIIYGINKTAELFLKSKYHQDRFIPACTQGGENLGGHDALSLEELKVYIQSHSVNRVVICSEFLTDIIKGLKDIGIEKEIVYFFDYQKSELIPIEQLELNNSTRSNTLFAFYDLAYNLPCYDATVFCLYADLIRKREKLDYIHFVIVPSSSEDNERGYSVFYDNSDYHWRIRYILEANFNCIQSSIGFSVLPFREMVYSFLDMPNSFPYNYTPNSSLKKIDTKDLLPFVKQNYRLDAFSPPVQASKTLNQFLEHRLKGRKLVTISLREYGQEPQRNSNLTEWARFARSLAEEEFFVVIIRDTYHCVDEPPQGFEQDNIEFFSLAAFNFEVRVALYQRAYINLCINNGPSLVLNFIENCRYLYFIWSDDSVPSISSDLYRKTGVVEGENYFFRQNAFQRLVWAKDSFDNISMAFEKLNQDIEAAAGKTHSLNHSAGDA